MRICTFITELGIQKRQECKFVLAFTSCVDSRGCLGRNCMLKIAGASRKDWSSHSIVGIFVGKMGLFPAQLQYHPMAYVCCGWSPTSALRGPELMVTFCVFAHDDWFGNFEKIHLRRGWKGWQGWVSLNFQPHGAVETLVWSDFIFYKRRNHRC